jgi:RimJ/RimL family protein N-acetyltransferase
MKWTLADLSHTLPSLIANGEAGEVIRELRSRLYSEEVWYLLRRDLEQPFEAPPAKIPIHVRPFEKADVPRILRERPIRRTAIEAGLETCYVAITQDGELCYMQWLIDSSQNELIQRRFAGLYSRLAPDEMLLEWAYTFRKYRGLGIMAPAMARISEEGGKKGAHHLYTFVEQSNIPSLRGCRSAGFRPYQIRSDHWRFFRCHEQFTPLPSEAKYPFELP